MKAYKTSERQCKRRRSKGEVRQLRGGIFLGLVDWVERVKKKAGRNVVRKKGQQIGKKKKEEERDPKCQSLNLKAKKNREGL